MDHAPNNPATNQLGPGLTEDQVRVAVERSGYPLQTIVADLLRSKPDANREKFLVQEEWSFVDRDTDELRTIDLLARLQLHDWDPQPRVRPQLSLLIECKQSPLPYVFFQTSGSPWLRDFPTVAGLRDDKIVIVSDDDPSSWTYTVTHALDLERDPFQAAPRFCHTLSKCVRKGSEVELSGSDAYNGLILPLVKALQHFVHAQSPVDTAWYFDCHLTVGIGVLDAPMIGVTVESAGAALVALPWVRVLRHEYAEEAEHFEREHLRVLDVVHKDYLQTYLEGHLMPFADRFAERVLRHTTELATGLAFVPRMGADGWDPVENRMQPRSTTSRLARNVRNCQKHPSILLWKERGTLSLSGGCPTIACSRRPQAGAADADIAFYFRDR